MLQVKLSADALAYSTQKAADAEAYRTERQAEAEAKRIQVLANALADNKLGIKNSNQSCINCIN